MSEDRNPWRWYYGHGRHEDAETYIACDSREQAIATAMSECEPGDWFNIGEAKYAEPSLKIFTADNVLDAFCDRNEECWGEGGPDFKTTQEADRDLEDMLNAAFAAWAEKHDHPWRVWGLEGWRNQEDICKGAP